MKIKRLLVILLLICCGSLAAQSRWSTPIVLSTRKLSPDLDIDRKTGDLHIVVVGDVEYATSGVTYIATDSLGNLLQQPETVPGTEADAGGWCFGPSVAVDSNGEPHVCYRKQWESLRFSSYYVNKRNGTWKNYVQLSDALTRGYMVRIAVDGSNRAHIGRGYAVDTPGERRLMISLSTAVSKMFWTDSIPT